MSLGLVVFILGLFGDASQDLVSAAALPVHIVWTGPPDCAGSEGTERYVRRMLADGNTTALRPESEVRVEVAKVPSGGRWDVSITTLTGDVSGERALRVDSCEAARRTVALLVALMIDPNVRPQSIDTPEAKDTAPEASTATPPAAIPPAAAAPKPPIAVPKRAPVTLEQATSSSVPVNTFHWLLGASGVANWGTLPSVSAGGRLRLGIIR